MSEVKWAYKLQAPVTWDANTWNMFDLSPSIPQGDSKFERVGNRCRLKTFQLRGSLSLVGIEPDPLGLPATVRCIMFNIRTQPSATSPGLTDVFDISAVTTNTEYCCYAPVNNTAVRVLYDKMYSMGAYPNGLLSNLPTYKTMKIRMRYTRNSKFTSNTSPTDLEWQNRLYMIILSSYGGTTEEQTLTFNFLSRQSFIDL